MTEVKTELIMNTRVSDVTNARFQRAFGLSFQQPITYSVFRMTLGRKTLYGCWSGGELRNGQVFLTELGRAALEALCTLPVGATPVFLMQELRLGKTPLKQKVRKIIQKTPSHSRICFFGDMTVELDGHLFPAFNVIGYTTLAGEPRDE